MTRYTAKLIVPELKITRYGGDALTERRLADFRKAQAETVALCKKLDVSFKFIVKQVPETHVREFRAERQAWLNNNEYHEDPCCGCGGIGAGWVRECPDDCYGRKWHDHINKMWERYTPKTIW